MRQLTPAQKGYITKLTKSKGSAERPLNATQLLARAVLRNPDDYVSRRVGEKTAAKLKRADYRVSGDRVLLHVPGKDRVSVRAGRIEYVRRRQRERVYLEAGADFLRRMESLPQRKLPAGQYVGFKFKDSPVIGTFHSVKDAMTYATKRRSFSQGELEAVSLVAIDTREGWEDDDDGEDYESEDSEF